jgi:hypothetical protein
VKGSRDVEVVVFDGVDLTAVLGALRPGGWVNLQPETDTEAEPSTGGGFFSALGARGPAVPFCTWLPGERSAGIQHGTGPKVARRIDIPSGWQKTQDHPRRGLVVRVPPGVPDEAVLRWLVATGEALCPMPLLGRWVAEIHR